MAPFRYEEEGDSEFEWNAYAELHLINSLAGLKATGVNYHWCLAIVYNKFTAAMGVDISLAELEKHLGTFYNFEAAARRPGNAVPFPNGYTEFALPTDEFPGVEMKKRTSTGGAGKTTANKTSSSTPTPASKATPSESKTEEKLNKKKPVTPVPSSEKNKQAVQSKKLRKKPATPQPTPKRLRR